MHKASIGLVIASAVRKDYMKIGNACIIITKSGFKWSELYPTTSQGIK